MNEQIRPLHICKSVSKFMSDSCLYMLCMKGYVQSIQIKRKMFECVQHVYRIEWTGTSYCALAPSLPTQQELGTPYKVDSARLVGAHGSKAAAEATPRSLGLGGCEQTQKVKRPVLLHM